MRVIGRNLSWGLLAQVCSAASGVILLPFVLYYLSANYLGLWFVFTTLAGLGYLLELGFQPTISRNVSYVYAGAESIEKEGMTIVFNNEKK